MAHRVDGVLVGYPIATPSLRISTRVPRDQKGAWPKLTRACVPRTDGNDAHRAPARRAPTLDKRRFMGLWATFFIETWKRKESRHAMEWGTIGFEDVERDRPEYAASSEASASASDDDDASTGSSSYESYTASSASYSGASDDDSAGAAWAAGAEGVGAAAAGAGTAYAAGGHSAELDYTGPELAHSAELDYQSPV